MQAISQVEGEIICIPNNMEKYISFSLIKKKNNNFETSIDTDGEQE